MNVDGTKSLIELARMFKDLKAFIHVSTAYAHCHLEIIEEQFYPMTDVNADQIIELCKMEDANVLNSVERTKSIIGKHPNSYTFTKALTENMLSEEAANFPLAIVRPSIVVAAWKTPFPGWVDNFNGPTGTLTTLALQFLVGFF
jgi:fatty acyl-CoA reductase